MFKVGDSVYIKTLTQDEWNAIPLGSRLGWLGITVSGRIMGKIGIITDVYPSGGYGVLVSGEVISWHFPPEALILDSPQQLTAQLPLLRCTPKLDDPGFKSEMAYQLQVYDIPRYDFPESKCSHNFRTSKTVPGKTKWCTICDHRELCQYRQG